MDALEPPASSPADAPNRRRSGRTVKQPILYQADPKISIPTNGTAKRKRAQRAESEVQDAEEDMDDEGSDEDSEPEEMKASKRKAKKAPRKPAAKKIKTAPPGGLTLAMRPAPNGVKKPSKPKPRKARPGVTMASGAEGTGLYGTLVSIMKQSELTCAQPKYFSRAVRPMILLPAGWTATSSTMPMQ